MRILGIDPGESGGLALLRSGLELDLVKMPWKDDELDYVALDLVLSELVPDVIFLEQPGGFKLGPSSAFSFGRTCGQIELICRQSGFPLRHTKPNEWTKIMHERIDKDLKPKAKSLIKARELFPDQSFLATPKSKKPHDGLIDAALIARFGQLVLIQEEDSKWGL